MDRYKDLTGQKFGRLTVIKQAERKLLPSGQRQIRWLCRCDCGNEINTSSGSLLKGRSRSCGCLQLENAIKANTKHGMYKTKIYRVHSSMLERCRNPKNPGYENYGGSGITVCEEWSGENGFINFLKWSEDNGYSENLSIDRIDNNKGYSPDNCRWADNFVQANNTRKNVNITWNGDTHSLSVWGRIKPNGLDYDTLRSRLRSGWSIEKTFSEPKHSDEKDTEGNRITVNGETHNVTFWCKKLGIQKSTFYRRIKSGWDVERAVTEPSRLAVAK